MSPPTVAVQFGLQPCQPIPIDIDRLAIDAEVDLPPGFHIGQPAATQRLSGEKVSERNPSERAFSFMNPRHAVSNMRFQRKTCLGCEKSSVE